MDVISYVLGLEAGKKSSGDGIELNIAYGDTAPEDTTKLWVKTSKPSGVIVTDKKEYQAGDGISIVDTGISSGSVIRALAAHWVDGDKIYFFGGNKGSGSSAKYIDTITCYDTLTQTFTTLNTVLPYATTKMGVVAYGAKIYLIGGHATSGSKRIYCFDTSDLTISTLSATLSITPSTLSFNAVTVGTKVYLFNNASLDGTNTTVECFDAETEQVSKPVSGLAGLSVRATVLYGGQNRIYWIGGRFGYVGASGTAYDTIKCIDVTDWSITQLKVKMTTPVWGATGALMQDTICVFSGEYSPKLGAVGARQSIQTIDLLAGVANEIELDNALFGCSYVEINGKLYTFYGYKNIWCATGSNLNTVYTFEPASYDFLLANGTVAIITKPSANQTVLVNTDGIKIDIGVDGVYKGNVDGIGEEVEAALYKDGAWANI